MGQDRVINAMERDIKESRDLIDEQYEKQFGRNMGRSEGMARKL